MTTQEVIKQYFDSLVKGDFKGAEKLKSPDHKRWISGEGSWPYGGWQTPQTMAEIGKIIRERFPEGLKITIEDSIVDGDKASVQLRNYAIRTDGRIYDNQIVFIVRVKNSLITELREFLDTIKVNELFCGPLDR